MEKINELNYNLKKKKKFILLLDNKKNLEECSYNLYEQYYLNRIKDKQSEQKNNQNKHKKFKLLRNFSSKFKKGLLTIESPHKSIFAKRILSEIIPKKISEKKMKLGARKKINEIDYDLQILNTPKANNSFLSNKFFINESKSTKLKANSEYTQNINKFLFKRSKSQVLSLTGNSSKVNIFEDKNKDSLIKDIIKEDKVDTNENYILQKKSNSASKKKPLILNLRKIPFIKPKKLIFKNINIKSDNKSLNYSKNKKTKKRIPKPSKPLKIYNKKCDMKKHLYHQKYISKFLTPINNFISNEFQFTDKEYEKINKEIHDYNYLMNNNEYSLYLNKRKKEKYKEFEPPKIPNIQKIIETKYFSIINELKNYKFKI